MTWTISGAYPVPFDLKLIVPRSRSVAETVTAPAAPLNTVQAPIDSRNCNDSGVCDGPEVIMYLALLPGRAPQVDVVPPTVKADPHKGIIRIGQQIPAGYRAFPLGWDATAPGTQHSRPTTTEPRGGGRNGS